MEFLAKSIRILAVLILLTSIWFFPYDLDGTLGGLDQGAPSVPDYLMRKMRYVLLNAGKLHLTIRFM